MEPSKKRLADYAQELYRTYAGAPEAAFTVGAGLESLAAAMPLKDMLECLGVTLQSFFSDDSAEKVVFAPQDMFEKEDEESGHKITWLVPDAQKNSMEPILLELSPGGKSPVLPPLESEEFGYVLRGQVTLVAGKRSYTVKKGDSFCLRPSATHYLENVSARPAAVLWVSTPPSF